MFVSSLPILSVWPSMARCMPGCAWMVPVSLASLIFASGLRFRARFCRKLALEVDQKYRGRSATRTTITCRGTKLALPS